MIVQSIAESIEISESIVIDYNENGYIIGIDIDNTSLKIDLKKIILNKLPVQFQAIMV